MTGDTTLFVVTDAELTEFFPGWRLPLAAPVRVTARHPFTGEPMSYDQWDPGRDPSILSGPTLFEQQGRAILSPVVPPDDAYPNWLEKDAPPLLRTFPHCAMKGITMAQLTGLAELLLGHLEPPARFADCQEDDGLIEGALPAVAVRAFSRASDSQLATLALELQNLGLWENLDSQVRKVRKNLGLKVNASSRERDLRRVRVLAAEAVRVDGHLFSHVLH